MTASTRGLLAALLLYGCGGQTDSPTPGATPAPTSAAPTTTALEPAPTTSPLPPAPTRAPDAVPRHLAGTARAFVWFARGRGHPPVDTAVELFVGGEPVGTISATEATDPANWQGCPASGSYAARVCPFSLTALLRPAAQAPRVGAISVSTVEPDNVCAPDGRALPAHLGTYSTVTISRPGSCTSYVAVRLFVNTAGQIVAADLTVGEP